MLIPKKNLSVDERELIKLFSSLDSEKKSNLLAFATFLAQQPVTGNDTEEERQAAEPKFIERPDTESVVAAIKRLSISYYMLERGDLLTDASTLMTSHVMRGRPAQAVIDDLEKLFAEQYQKYLVGGSHDAPE